MKSILHITSGDIAGDLLIEAKLDGDVFVWRDILYNKERKPGWPDRKALKERAEFIDEVNSHALGLKPILKVLKAQYYKLIEAAGYNRVVLWFDACLFDQAMLVHILTCLKHQGMSSVELIVVDAFPGIEPFHGLGQMEPYQLASVYGDRRPVSPEQFLFAEKVDEAFALQDVDQMRVLSEMSEAPIPWIPAAAARWLQEQPNPETGLGLLQQLALEAIQSGKKDPGEIREAVAEADMPPRFWGDTMLWREINALAEREPPLVEIDGPAERLPQWKTDYPLDAFTITAI